MFLANKYLAPDENITPKRCSRNRILSTYNYHGNCSKNEPFQNILFFGDIEYIMKIISGEKTVYLNKLEI